MESYQRDRSLPDPKAEPTISVIRAGQILGMSRNAAYAAAKDGRFPTVAISASRAVVLTAQFLDRYRLRQGAEPSMTPGGVTTPQTPALPHRARPRIGARWRLDANGAGHLILSSGAWPSLLPEQRAQVARAVIDAAEAAIGIALGRAGLAS